MKPFTKIASVLFALVALAHLARLVLHVLVMVGSHAIPMSASVVGFIVALALSVGLWKEAK